MGTWRVLTLVPALLLFASAETAAQPSGEASSHVEMRRVEISLTFSGQRVFLHGRPPEGTETVLAVMRGPRTGKVGLVRKDRVLVFWPGVERYDVSGMPGLYLVNLHCTECNRRIGCAHAPDLEGWKRLLQPQGIVVGPEDLRGRALVTDPAEPLEPEEAGRVLHGLWDLQSERGLYGIRPNAIRLDATGRFYHTFELPADAPEGKYRIHTFFARAGEMTGVAENELLVRKSGLVAWLSRLSERNAVGYASLTVIIPILAGVLASIVFRRGQKH